jgi:hypothetical protein
MLPVANIGGLPDSTPFGSGALKTCWLDACDTSNRTTAPLVMTPWNVLVLIGAATATRTGAAFTVLVET